MERALLMTWHGQHAASDNAQVRRAYLITNESVRPALIGNLSHLPDVSIGSPIGDYAGVMGNAKFCLCPKGASSYTSRVFEALFAGCVPVILSDHVRLPFEGTKHVRWQDFSLSWPMERTDVSLYDYLKSLISDHLPYVLQLQAKAAEVRCWFDYFSIEKEPKDCSPYLAILQSLQARVAQMPPARRKPSDETSKARLMPSTEGGPPPTGASLVEVLAAQEKAASEAQVDDVTYARQREAIYNQFIMAGRPCIEPESIEWQYQVASWLVAKGTKREANSCTNRSRRFASQ
eukprot:symbB.v1.2.016707.t2/scaffold1282.1/size127056/2